MIDQQGNVLGPLTKGRDRDADAIQARAQVLSEQSGGDLRFKVLARGCDHSHVHVRVGAVSADPPNLARLQEAEDDRLHGKAQLADVVEKQGAVRRNLKETRLVPVRPGKTASHVAKQFRLHEHIGQALAAERDEGRRRAWATVMDQSGDSLFPGARLAGDQHACIRTSCAIHFALEGANCLAAADETRPAVRLCHGRHVNAGHVARVMPRRPVGVGQESREWADAAAGPASGAAHVGRAATHPSRGVAAWIPATDIRVGTRLVVSVIDQVARSEDEIEGSVAEGRQVAHVGEIHRDAREMRVNVVNHRWRRVDADVRSCQRSEISRGALGAHAEIEHATAGERRLVGAAHL